MPTQDSKAPAPSVYFPCMHAGLLPTRLAGVAAFFDPGLATASPESGESLYRPADLPLDQAALMAAIGQYEALEREVKNPRELDAFFSTRFEEVFPESSRGIEDALRDRMAPGRPKASRAGAVKAQLGLCLAWRMEEKILELSGLGGGVDRSMREFAENLGLSDEDADELPPGLLDGTGLTDKKTLAGEFSGPWRPLLDAMLRFLPGHAALVVTEARVAEAYAEAGLLDGSATTSQAGAFVPTPFADLFTAVALPGWRLLLGNRPRPESPWLDAQRTVLIPVTWEE
ncbi:hypothetical protein G3N56_04005 [Desulfovibrio sulfodismutans]|uniref:Uncharacterized protein n=1 Tax=Desulfolutivibrio sulfodismutans TaxID=63561 RepID=A0A7K3NI85_9BACT|nr:hypothetical protein [Desulfolutivibrio sulfodismutans]NDY55906.1 hypothetical protein [Desulfolutivibrio sulfodismutans]QLA11171.1 hypothetical protein GD606_02215 [Desulfolutivibrio sulfodismutans DSM 3696]